MSDKPKGDVEKALEWFYLMEGYDQCGECGLENQGNILAAAYRTSQATIEALRKELAHQTDMAMQADCCCRIAMDRAEKAERERDESKRRLAGLENDGYVPGQGNNAADWCKAHHYDGCPKCTELIASLQSQLALAKEQGERMREALRRVRIVLDSRLVCAEQAQLGDWNKDVVLGWVDSALAASQAAQGKP